MTDQPEPSTNALVAEAMTKSGVLWIDVVGDRTWPAWHVWSHDRAYVVSGPGEQPLPWLPDEVTVILRSKDTGGRLVTTRARTRVLDPGSDDWEAAAAILRPARLNAVDDSVSRWAAACTVTELVPYGDLLESPGAYAVDDLRAVPARTAATTTSWRPWHWHGRGRRQGRG